MDAYTVAAGQVPPPPLSALAELNPEQRAAAEHRGGPLLVVAGAGSGKTLTLAARVAALVAEGADPQRLLLMTFSRRAAAEMERRVGRLLHEALGLHASVAAPTLPWCGTFHSIGARLLRELAPRIGLARQFDLLDRADAQELMAGQRQRLGLAAMHERFPLAATCLAIHSRAVNSRAALADLLASAYPWVARWQSELQALFEAYGEAKRRQQLLDYDDLLLLWWHLMQQPVLAASIGARFDHVLVDEYQDTNRLQAEILLALRPGGQGLTVVGDDAQAIYSFRAAEARNMLDFPVQFTPAARVLTLERNYRSTRPLLEASNAVIALAAERFAKTLWSERESSARPRLVAVADDAAQAAWVADEVLRQREQGLKLKSQAVLFRTSSHSAALELELARRRIPFVKFGGLRFFESAHVKDLLSLLRWASNPRARLAGSRVAHLVPGLGPARVARLLDAMDASDDPAAALAAYRAPPAAASDFAALLELFTALRESPSWPHEIEAALAWYQPHLERLHDDARTRRADLDALVRIAAGHASRERFLTEIALDPPEASSDESGAPHRDEDYLILSTIHSAKGQEWNAVSVLNVVDGCMPSDLATGSAPEIDEERRLLYVAMTRARDSLNLLVPQRFYVSQQRARGDRHLYASRSRFLPSALEPLFELVHPQATMTEEADPADGPPLFDAAAALLGRWR
ncbi:MAG: ATP-dependent helicase [Burkholderiales bacterium]|nr:ATP-dependent helicase [Burkholderiales bacterium]